MSVLSKLIFVIRIQNLLVGNAQISHRHSRMGVVQHLADFLDWQLSTTVIITPKFDENEKGDETVVATLMPDGSYFVGAMTEATITIKDFVDGIFADSFE